ITGNPRRGGFSSKLLWSENADLKFSANNGVKDDNKNLRSMENIVQHSEGNGTEERLKRPQTCTESSTKYHNHPANETDNREEQRLPTLEENPAKRIRNESDEERKHLKFTVKV
ncbi:unnamed protein product, partial [Porites lobata]